MVVAEDGRVVALDGLARLHRPEPLLPPRPVAELRRLLVPQSAVVVGASAEGMNPGRIILRNLVEGGGVPRERIWAVHPKAAEIDGCRAFPALADLPEPADLAIVSVAADRGADAVVQEIVEKRRARTVTLIAGGFGETEHGREAEARIRAALAESHRAPDGGVLLNGGNCLGIISVPGAATTRSSSRSTSCRSRCRPRRRRRHADRRRPREHQPVRRVPRHPDLEPPPCRAPPLRDLVRQPDGRDRLRLPRAPRGRRGGARLRRVPRGLPARRRAAVPRRGAPHRRERPLGPALQGRPHARGLGRGRVAHGLGRRRLRGLRGAGAGGGSGRRVEPRPVRGRHHDVHAARRPQGRPAAGSPCCRTPASRRRPRPTRSSASSWPTSRRPRASGSPRCCRRESSTSTTRPTRHRSPRPTSTPRSPRRWPMTRASTRWSSPASPRPRS